MGTIKVGNVARLLYTDLDGVVRYGHLGVVVEAVVVGGDTIYTVDPSIIAGMEDMLPFKVRDAYLWECGPAGGLPTNPHPYPAT